MIDAIKNFLCSQLIGMRDKVKSIHLTYIYEETLNYHTIIVEPLDVFVNNHSFHLLEKDISNRLYERFGIDDILFTEKVSYIHYAESEVVLRLAPLPVKEEARMKFNYDMLDIPSFKKLDSEDCLVGSMGSYALAA